MSNGMTVAPNTNMAIVMPANLADIFGDIKPNIATGEQIPTLSIGGKVWKIVKDGNETPITTMVDGEPMPVQTVKVIILNQVPTRSRAYFEGSYTEGSKESPVCWSIRGDRPEPDCPSPQGTSCEACPQAVKGSKINDQGDATVACPTSKRISVIPSNKLDFTALLLKLPVTSLWEKEEAEKANGWFAYDAYLKFLKSNGVPFTCAVRTILKFDSKTKYPKVLFKYDGVLDEAAMRVAASRMNSEEVLHVLGLDKVEQEHKVLPAAEKQVEKKAEVRVPEVVEDFGFGEEAQAAPAVVEKPKKVEKPAKTAKETKKPEPTQVTVVETDEELSDVLSDWE